MIIQFTTENDQRVARQARPTWDALALVVCWDATDCLHDPCCMDVAIAALAKARGETA